MHSTALSNFISTLFCMRASLAMGKFPRSGGTKNVYLQFW